MSELFDIHRKNLQLAYKFIQGNAIEKNLELKQKYLSFAKKLPILVMGNGLIPTLLFISKKDSKEFEKFSRQIVEFFKDNFSDIKDINDLITKLINSSDETKLMEFTKRLVDYASAIKEVAEAYLSGGDESGPQTP
jgi:CRISPR type III-B/RAMP module-associated protein Cmr5